MIRNFKQNSDILEFLILKYHKIYHCIQYKYNLYVMATRYVQICGLNVKIYVLKNLTFLSYRIFSAKVLYYLFFLSCKLIEIIVGNI